MSEGTVHPLAKPVGRTHAAGVFDWHAVPVDGSESVCIRA